MWDSMRSVHPCTSRTHTFIGKRGIIYCHTRNIQPSAVHTGFKQLGQVVVLELGELFKTLLLN